MVLAVNLAWLAVNPATFPRGQLGFSQIPGHCATQCRVVVIPDMVALTQNKKKSLLLVVGSSSTTEPRI
jgi:hypothetical protein